MAFSGSWNAGDLKSSMQIFTLYSMGHIIRSIEFSHSTQSWHLIQMHQSIFKEWKRINFFPKILIKIYISVVDPEFSRGGCVNSLNGIILQIFLLKTAWKWKNSDPRGHASLATPLDLSMHLAFGVKMNSFVYNTLGDFQKNDFLFILWIFTDVFELNANVVNFLYYEKTRVPWKIWCRRWHLVGSQPFFKYSL